MFIKHPSYKRYCNMFLTVNLITNYTYTYVVQLLSRVQLFATPWTAAHQATLSFTISQSLFKFMSIELMMPFSHLKPLSPSFPPALHKRMTRWNQSSSPRLVSPYTTIYLKAKQYFSNEVEITKYSGARETINERVKYMHCI